MRKVNKISSVDYETINDYLHFAFVPKNGEGQWPFEIDELKKYANISIAEDFDQLLVQGIKTFDSVFDKLTEGAPHSHHVVPLSAGLDSRAIIAALVDRVAPEKITAVTFGTPGTFEYEIPQKIAELTGINHKLIDATQVEFTFDKLVQAVKNGGRWTSTPDMWFNQKAMNILGDRKVNKWSGFIGDYIGGSYAHKGSNVKDVYRAYASYEKKCNSVHLTHKNYVPAQSLVSPPVKNLYNLTEFELITLSNRIPSSSATICLHDDNEIISPIVHSEWVSFMFRIPRKYRIGCKLFHAIMLKRFPEIMNIPIKNAYGATLGAHALKKQFYRIKSKARKINAAYKKDYRYAPLGVNYLYYSEAIRQHESLRNVITEACSSIDEREITSWIKAKDILQEHMERKKDHTRGLLILLGLEVNIRSLDNI